MFKIFYLPQHIFSQIVIYVILDYSNIPHQIKTLLFSVFIVEDNEQFVPVMYVLWHWGNFLMYK